MPRPRKSSNKSWMSRVGIVVIAAVMVEIISIVQYQRLRNIMQQELMIRSHVVVGAMADEIQHALELVETTMRENLWDVKRSVVHPDSIFLATARLIDDNPHVVGGCIAFSPGYYSSMGRLYEPYASKQMDGAITIMDIAGPGHDYTQNEEFQKVLENKQPSWTEPYTYGPDSLKFTTYSYPILDKQDRVVAICGLDVDLSWLGDTLNARQPFPSSFGLLLTQDGKLVAGPLENRTSRAEVQQAVDILNGVLPQSANPSLSFTQTSLKKDPHWQLVQVYKTDEVYAKMRRMRTRQMFLILLGLAILAFMIERYARNEKKLRTASEEQARISSELAVARSIQSEMLPKSFPSFVYGSLEPAREVGGDLYDFYERDGKLFFCIGDVSGKGVPSAMLMSVAHSLFRVLSRKEELPSRILEGMNRELCCGNDSNMFVTFFLGCLDLYTGKLHYANAGHDKPFLLEGSVAMVPTKSNFPLGVFPDTEFEGQELVLSPGSMLLLYTDGLTEAKSFSHEAFGRPRVQEVLKAAVAGSHTTPETLIQALNTAVHGFVGEAPQSDDLTMLAVCFAPGELVREQIVLENNVEQVDQLGQFVKAFCARLELDRKSASGLRLALEETVVNVINYAYPKGEKGSVTVYADSNRKEVRFTIVDAGVPFDPTAVLSADTTLDVQNRPIGGLGILLTRKLMDSVSYCRKGDKNVLTLTKIIL